MTGQEDTRKKPRRDLLLVLLILPLGILCMFMTGQAAIRLAPEWVLEANMRSMLDPNATFAALGIPPIIEPLNPAILTRPAWGGLFLTPQAAIPTRVVAVFSPTPINTPPPPPPPIATPIENPEPTATLPGLIILPTSIGPSYSDLAIQVSDNSPTYTPGTQITYTIIVTNLGPDDAPRFNIIDNIPAVITGLTVTCAPANLCGTNTSSGNTISFTGARLPAIGTNQITITIRGTVISSATGILVNTASINIPSGVRVRDPSTDNNSSTDRDTQLSVYDLAITKSDGVDTYAAGNPLTYTVVVTNTSGPSDALGIRITDNKSVQIASWTWVCTTVINASGCNGVTNSTNNFNDPVTIRVGGRIVYTVTANLAAVSTNPQNISNTASILLPSGTGFFDPNLSNNSATDTDIPHIDLLITKDDGVTAYAPGGTVSYTVTVTNNSTFNLTGITVSDPKPLQVSDWAWCVSPPCPAPITTDFISTINLAAGGSLAYTVMANISETANGELVNTATVSAPAGLVDAVPGNDSATDTDTPGISVDLAITKDNGVTTYTPGGTVDYTIIVTNNSAINLTGVTVTDNISPLIASWTWTCTPGAPGATCSSGSSSNNIVDTINLPANATVMYTITATINSFATGALQNTASVSPPDGFVDGDMSNNTATHTDSSSSGEPDIGPPDGGIISPPAGSTTTYFIHPAISSDGTSTPDFVFYEFYRSDIPGIAMDIVIIELSQNGNSWTPVFNWGDGNLDLNSKVHLAVNALCSGSETDGCNITASPTYLHQSNGFYSGIEIDIDSLGLSGSYPWIQFKCPLAGNSDGTCDIDAIQPYYP